MYCNGHYKITITARLLAKITFIFYGTFFGKVISHDRYKQIHCYIHLCHKEESILKDQPGHDRFYKIKGLPNLIILKFQSLYIPNQNIRIDENMLPLKGRISFHQFSSSKRIQFGIKAWVLADLKSGYVYGFSLYIGKIVEVQKDLSGTGVSSLTTNLLNQG